MKYLKVINLLDNTLNQPSKFRTKKRIAINDGARGTYNTNSQIKFKTSMLKSSLCDYSDTYILVSGTITITGDEDNDAAKQADEINKRVKFIDCISETNKTQIDNTRGVDVVMLMFDLTEYSDNCSKTSGSVW